MGHIFNFANFFRHLCADLALKDQDSSCLYEKGDSGKVEYKPDVTVNEQSEHAQRKEDVKEEL